MVKIKQHRQVCKILSDPSMCSLMHVIEITAIENRLRISLLRSDYVDYQYFIILERNTRVSRFDESFSSHCYRTRVQRYCRRKTNVVYIRLTNNLLASRPTITHYFHPSPHSFLRSFSPITFRRLIAVYFTRVILICRHFVADRRVSRSNPIYRFPHDVDGRIPKFS